ELSSRSLPPAQISLALCIIKYLTTIALPAILPFHGDSRTTSLFSSRTDPHRRPCCRPSPLHTRNHGARRRIHCGSGLGWRSHGSDRAGRGLLRFPPAHPPTLAFHLAHRSIRRGRYRRSSLRHQSSSRQREIAFRPRPQISL